VSCLTILPESPEAWSTESTVLHAEAALPTNCVTKAQARDYTKRIAYHFRHTYDIGTHEPGSDVVVCISSGQVLLSNIFYGVIAAGGLYSAASASSTHLELVRQIRQGKSRLIVASPDCKNVAIKAAEECEISLDRVLVLDSMGGKRILQNVSGTGRNFIEGEGKPKEKLDWEVITDRKRLENSVICFVYSSGTTGIPKGMFFSSIPSNI
jgi:long-subunit acyl-CoA synthetase (AMP-forming)